MSGIWPVVFFYLGLGAVLTLEEAGLFLLPGDLSLIGAGVYSSQGGPAVFVAWLVASLGMVLGSLALFFTVRRSTRSTQVLPARLRALIHRYGAWGVGGARLVPGLRNATVFVAAAARLRPSRFLLGLAPAAAVWSGLLLALGWFGGDTLLGLYAKIHGAPGVRFLALALLCCGGLTVAVRVYAMRGQRAVETR